MLLGQCTEERPVPEDCDLRQAHVQTQFKARLSQIAQKVGLPAEFADGTTAGFYGCQNELRLRLVERVVRACQDLKLSLDHWGSDQCVVIYLLTVSEARRLDAEKYINFWPSQRHKLDHAHVVHFLGTNRHYKGLYRQLASMTVDALHERTGFEAV